MHIYIEDTNYNLSLNILHHIIDLHEWNNDILKGIKIVLDSLDVGAGNEKEYKVYHKMLDNINMLNGDILNKKEVD